MVQTKFQVLLLGSDAKLLDAVSAAIQPAGGTVTFAANLPDLSRLIQSQGPDLLLLDLKSTGSESLDWLQQHQQNPPAKPIFTVAIAPGKHDPELLLKVSEAGVNQLLAYPGPGQEMFRAQLEATCQLKRRNDELLQRVQEQL
ncbi:MAG TPA: hypothetical protein VNZ25_01240 [Candidatus Angelobacter sp.]|nr:hypothetical protein [Candidatus Angelobacter sp.]